MYKKLPFWILACLSFQQMLVAQPLKLWSRLYGGNAGEYANESVVLNDSIILTVGRSSSTDLGAKGLDDAAIFMFNKNAYQTRIRTFGSPSNDVFNGLTMVPGGRMVCAGIANGSGGDVSTQYGLLDGWMLMYDPVTNMKIWEKNYGGSNNDQINDVMFLETGKILFAGATRSTDRDLTANKGSFDLMVGTVDETGAVVRVRNLGGSKEDIARKLSRADGANFWVAGETQSSEEGDFTGLKNKGGRDVFLMKFNRNTSLIQTNMYGTAGDDLIADMATLTDGSLLMCLNISSAGGDVDTTFGGKDIFLMRLAQDGRILWKKTLGGTGDDELVKLAFTSDQSILLLCSSTSADGNFPVNYGEKDINLVKLDSLGNWQWTKNYGGRRTETPGSIVVDSENLIFTVNASFSIDRDLDPTNINTPNFWVMNLYECPLIESEKVEEICLADTTTINGKQYYLGNDTGTDTLVGASFRGCDSIVHVKVFFNAPSTEFLKDTLCFEATRTINGVVLDRNKPEHVFNLDNQFGCDSTLIVNLVFTDEIKVKDTMIVNDNGSRNGSIRVTIQGGTAPYGYRWSNGFQSTQISGLAAGEYTLTITDSKGCMNTFSFTVKSSVATHDEQSPEFKLQYQDGVWRILSEEPIAELHLYNPEGRIIGSYRVEDQIFEFESAPLPTGLILGKIRFREGNTGSFKILNVK
jgi:hypothetical protein